ncbi:hypothetical protein QYM36_002670 [Artemia franciscana]|uniref:CTLH domain-containing protein n=1 Tax=Artemia franciscana TaxID=6661 RepID=A0AA88IDF3_ARTSF|nr:hypothetical protein QYM36_002670 [Artemia franciscana]
MDYNFEEEDWKKKLEKHKLSRNDINNVIMDYLCIEGFKDAAEKFAAESGLKPTIELDSMDERIRVKEALECGKIEEAIHLINEKYPSLLDKDHTLYFRLQQQQMIELIRNQRVEEALQFAQDRLGECAVNDPAVLPEVERTLALLAFDDPEKSPFADLLQLSHRQKVTFKTFECIYTCCQNILIGKS